MTEKPTAIDIRRDTVPAAVAYAVATALQKIPADCWPTAAAFSEALDGTGRDERRERRDEAARPTSLLSRFSSLLFVALVLATIVAVWGWTRHPGRSEAANVVRFAIQP